MLIKMRLDVYITTNSSFESCNKVIAPIFRTPHPFHLSLYSWSKAIPAENRP